MAEQTATLDPLDPELKPVAELIKRLPRKPSPPVVSRWIQKITRGTRLGTLLICGQHYSTETEFRRFIRAIQPRPTEPAGEHHPAVDRQLRDAGFDVGSDSRPAYGRDEPRRRSSRQISVG